jgi:hypothetical protein
MKLKSFLTNCWLFASGFGLMFIADLSLWSYSATQVYAGRGLEQFKLGHVDIPKFLGAGATFLDVFILNIATVIALLIALYCRYRYYEPERDILRKLGKEKEGRTGFWDDLGSDD